MQGIKNIIILFLLVLVAMSYAFGQAGKSYSNDDEKDTLVMKYLADTLNATNKIKLLLDEACTMPNTPNGNGEAIKRFQIALTLVPFAKDSSDILARLYANFGTKLFIAGANELSFQYLKQALTYIRAKDKTPNDRAYNLLGKIGSFYLGLRQYDSVQHYYQQAINEAEAMGLPIWIAASYNNMGIFYDKTQQYQLASQCYDTALKKLILLNHNDSALHESIIDNKAELAIKERNLLDAVEYYKGNLSFVNSSFQISSAFKARAGIAQAYLLQKKNGLAFEQIELLKRYLATNDPSLNVEDNIRYHQLRKQLFDQTGNWKEKALEQEKISAIQDSVNTQNNAQLNALLQALTNSQVYNYKKELQIHILQIAQQERDLRINKLITIATIMLSAVLLVLLFLFFKSRSNQQRNRIEMHKMDKQLAEANLKNKQLEQAKLEEELHYKTKDISDLALYLSKLKDVNDSMMERLEEIKSKKPEEQKAAINTMTNELGLLIHSHEKLNMVHENIELVNKEFNAKLMKEYPDLTKSEIELCGFFRMNMSNKEIGLMKNISPQSVKMARYRMRKKLGLPSEVDMYKFLSDY